MAKAVYEFKNIMEDVGLFCRCTQHNIRAGHKSITNWHEHIEILYCIEGDGSVFLENRHHPFENGNIVIANSGVIHSLVANTETCYICIHIDNEFCLSNGINTSLTAFQSFIEQDGEVASAIVDLQRAVCDNKPLKTARVNLCLIHLLIQLTEKHTVSPQKELKTTLSFQRIKSIIQFIRQNFDQDLSLSLLSAEAGINKYQLTREFKAVTGHSLNEHINSVRCDEARKLIAEGTSVSEAAYICGYRNLSYFSKTYKRHFGKLPSKH